MAALFLTVVFPSVELGICNTSAAQVGNYRAQTIFSLPQHFPLLFRQCYVNSPFDLFHFRRSSVYMYLNVARITRKLE